MLQLLLLLLLLHLHLLLLLLLLLSLLHLHLHLLLLLRRVSLRGRRLLLLRGRASVPWLPGWRALLLLRVSAWRESALAGARGWPRASAVGLLLLLWWWGTALLRRLLLLLRWRAWATA